MKQENISPVDSGSFAAYWQQYNESSELPACHIVFKDLIENIHNYALGTYYWNIGCLPEGKIAAAGGALEKLTGHTEADWIGAPPDFAFSNFLPEDIPFAMAYVLKFDQYLQSLPVADRMRIKASIYARLKIPGGSSRWFAIQYPGLYYDKDGRLIYILAVCSDISHIKTDSKAPFMSILDTKSEEQQVFLCYNPEQQLLKQELQPVLSQREREIITMLANGKSSKQISSLLYISKSTVDNHRQILLKKLGAASTAEIIRMAVEKGIV
jgi:DNA-binding CsgD family transcriptional regulator